MPSFPAPTLRRQPVAEQMLYPSQLLFFSFMALYCILIVSINIVSVKVIPLPFFPDYALTFGDFLYPITFLLTDITAEVWGKRHSQWLVIFGLISSLLFVGILHCTRILTPHPSWFVMGNSYGYHSIQEYQAAFDFVFNTGALLVAMSAMSFLCSQSLDILLFHRLKAATQGRFLWLRNNVSTLSSQGIDTLLFFSGVYYFGMGLEGKVVFQMALVSYIIKGVLALCDTPFCYLGVWVARQCQKMDLYAAKSR